LHWFGKEIPRSYLPDDANVKLIAYVCNPNYHNPLSSKHVIIKYLRVWKFLILYSCTDNNTNILALLSIIVLKFLYWNQIYLLILHELFCLMFYNFCKHGQNLCLGSRNGVCFSKNAISLFPVILQIIVFRSNDIKVFFSEIRIENEKD
jgi:hypothetical protein